MWAPVDKPPRRWVRSAVSLHALTPAAGRKAFLCVFFFYSLAVASVDVCRHGALSFLHRRGEAAGSPRWAAALAGWSGGSDGVRCGFPLSFFLPLVRCMPDRLTLLPAASVARSCRPPRVSCTRLPPQQTVYDEVEIEDMEWNSELDAFTWSCPCGDIFRLTVAEMRAGEEIATCPSCTLLLRVIYDDADIPGGAAAVGEGGVPPPPPAVGVCA